MRGKTFATAAAAGLAMVAAACGSGGEEAANDTAVIEALDGNEASATNYVDDAAEFDAAQNMADSADASGGEAEPVRRKKRP